MLYVPENITELNPVRVFTHNILSYEDLDLEKIKAVQYECLDISHDLNTLVAVVCHDDPEDITDREDQFVIKCCAQQDDCDGDHVHDWIAPRRILHPESHQMTGGVSWREWRGGEGRHCPAGDTVLTLPWQYVFTDGSLSPGEKTDRLPYLCISSAEQGLLARVCQTDYNGREQEQPGQSAELFCLGSYLETFRLLNTITAVVSCVFLIITFLVYIKLPEFKNLHGKIVLSNIVSILVVTLYLSLVYHLPSQLDDIACKVLGYFGYFFTISMFSWMTIMSFDLCWTFKRSAPPGSTRADHKFTCYSCLAWGGSAVLTATVLLLDLLPVSFTRPGVGTAKCFLQDGAQGLYLHLPILVLLSLNMVFFLTTTLTLYRSKVATKVARLGRQHSSRQERSPLVRQETVEQFVCQFLVLPG